MNENSFDRWLRTFTDTESDEPRTALQHGLFKASKIAANVVTGASFALLISMAWLTLVRLAADALRIDLSEHGPLATLLTLSIPVALAIRGATVMQTIIFAVRRYQVFALIGLLSVVSAVLANFGPAMRCAASAGDAVSAAVALLRLLADALSLNGVLALPAVDCR